MPQKGRERGHSARAEQTSAHLSLASDRCVVSSCLVSSHFTCAWRASAASLSRLDCALSFAFPCLCSFESSVDAHDWPKGRGPTGTTEKGGRDSKIMAAWHRRHLRCALVYSSVPPLLRASMFCARKRRTDRQRRHLAGVKSPRVASSFLSPPVAGWLPLCALLSPSCWLCRI